VVAVTAGRTGADVVVVLGWITEVAGRVDPGHERVVEVAVVVVAGFGWLAWYRFWFASNPAAILLSPAGFTLRPCVLYRAFGFVDAGEGTGLVRNPRPYCDCAFGVIACVPDGVIRFAGPAF
jgi:hypothetical protein